MGSEDSPQLTVAWSVKKQLWSQIALALFAGVYAVGWATGFLEVWIAVPGLVVFGGALAYGGVVIWRMRSQDWVLRLDRNGVTVRDHGLVPWSDIAEVRVTGLQPSWYFVFFRRWTAVVSFIGREGVDLPAPPFPGRPRHRWLRAMGRRLYGTDLMVMPSAMTVSLSELLAGVVELSDTPVVNRLKLKFRRDKTGTRDA